MKQIFHINEKLFLFNTSDELKIFSQQESFGNYSYLLSLFLNKSKIKKILFNQENYIFFALSEDGKLYKFYYPTYKTLLISEKLEKEKREPLIKKITNSENENTGNQYTCSLIKLNYDESVYNDIYLMKNYLIVFDKNDDIFYLNIENINTDFSIDEENTSSSETNKLSENGDSSKNLIEDRKNSINNLLERSNSYTEKKEKKILIDEDELESEGKKSDMSLNKEDTNLINLDASCNSNNDYSNKKNKFEGYFDNQAKTNFHDILLKLGKTYNKIIKIDCSESNLLFADENQKVNLKLITPF